MPHTPAALRGIDRGRIALDQAVVDVDVGMAGRDPDPGGADVAVGDVNLAAVLLERLTDRRRSRLLHIGQPQPPSSQGDA